MDNATPLKPIKKPVKRFFLIANIILLLITVVIGVYYLKIYIPSTTKPKASCTPNTIYCRRDDPSVCPNIISSLAGYRCDGNGNSMGCSGYDACARIVYPGQSCSGLSGYDSNGSTPANFVGCCNRQNCWCYPPGGSGTVSCVDNSSGVSCGWNPDGCGSPPQENTPIPTPTSALVFTCPPADSWCTNHGGIYTTVPFDVTDWQSCRNWCDTWLNGTNTPICQYNGDGLRNCWVNFAPNTGIAGCIWSNSHPPYGSVWSGYNCPRSTINNPTPTVTPFITNTPTPTRTPTPTATRTPTPSVTPIVSSTPSVTPIVSSTPSVTPIVSSTPSVTPIVSSTPSVTPLISNTPTVTPLVSNTPGPSATPIPVLCGTKDCDNATNPCRSGYNCVQANDGSNYCTSPDFTVACKANPSYNTCCIAPGEPTATPTEIILVKTTISPTVVVKLLQTGMIKSFMYLIPALIMLLGLIL